MLFTTARTNNKKVKLNFEIEFEQPFDLRATGVDASNSKTQFFNRLIYSTRPIFSVDFTLPISPKELLISFTNEVNNNDNMYRIVSMEADFLKNPGVDLTAFDHKNIEWLKKFCKEASYLPCGEYRQIGSNVWINYLPQITENGVVLDTPARVDHDTGEIQINASMFRNFTVPIRMVILTHEFSHWRYDNTNETFCDLEALRICLGLGFPKTECIYAFTNILNSTHQNDARMKQIVNYINNF